MNHDLLNISLKQGKQFNNYQTKIKTDISKTNFTNKKSKKEGFVSGNSTNSNSLQNKEQIVTPNNNEDSFNMEQTTKSTNNANQKDLDELKQLQDRYNALIQQYTDIRKKIGKSSLATISRVSPNNPYLGKNLLFTDGTICYITSQGVARPYTDWDIYTNTTGKNGCPKDLVKINIPWSSEYIEGATIPTIPPLIVGSYMKSGQSCGFEGDNVYASTLINNPSSSYVGCYNDKPTSSNVNIIPVMNSSGTVNGFTTDGVSSIYLGKTTYGAWAAFDQDPNTFWHSDTSSEHKYNAKTGVYEGSNSAKIANMSSRVPGEFLRINMPGIHTSSVQNITINQYSISPRLDNNLFTTRSPNSWYVLGWSDVDSMWHQVDRQQNQNFTNGTPKVYNVSTPGSYAAYLLLIDKVGNDDQTTNRYCVQVAEWNLFSNSDVNFTNDQRAMIFNPDVISYTSFDKCQEYAIDNGYQYFGLQDVQSDGNAACLVSNDIARTQIYGNANNQTTLIPIWSSNTSGSGLYVQVSGQGILQIYDVNGTIIFNSNGELTNCESWGTIRIDTATYGGNCGVQIGNVSDQVRNNFGCEWYETCSIPISNSTFGDPSKGCAKSFDLSYKCGSAPFSKNIETAEGQTLVVDCGEHIRSKCKFHFILQDDGNACLYKGEDPAAPGESVWCSQTSGKQLQANPDWEASKGKFGRNWMVTGQNLGPDEWIGSNDGSIKLIMQSDGNLVLYTSETKLGCKVINDKTYGGGWINAVYQLNNVGNKSTLGKIGYVDSESNLREYPDSMIGFINDYQIYQNTDSVGNDITSLVTSDQNGCQTACNNNADCAAFVYQGSSQTCWLKNRSAYPRGDKQPNNDVLLGVRQPGLMNSKSCSDKIVNIDTIQYDNYLKGQAMTSDTRCSDPLVSQSDQIEFDNIKSQLITLGNDIISKMENLYNEDNKINENLNTTGEQFKKDLEKYKALNLKIKKELNLQDNNMEGMQNLNMNDINGMLSDSDLRVLQENYSYIMWSILAVGLLTITINTMKK